MIKICLVMDANRYLVEVAILRSHAAPRPYEPSGRNNLPPKQALKEPTKSALIGIIGADPPPVGPHRKENTTKREKTTTASGEPISVVLRKKFDFCSSPRSGRFRDLAGLPVVTRNRPR